MGRAGQVHTLQAKKPVFGENTPFTALDRKRREVKLCYERKSRRVHRRVHRVSPEPRPGLSLRLHSHSPRVPVKRWAGWRLPSRQSSGPSPAVPRARLSAGYLPARYCASRLELLSSSATCCRRCASSAGGSSSPPRPAAASCRLARRSPLVEAPRGSVRCGWYPANVLPIRGSTAVDGRLPAPLHPTALRLVRRDTPATARR